jgi:hypothetical protein
MSLPKRRFGALKLSVRPNYSHDTFLGLYVAEVDVTLISKRNTTMRMRYTLLTRVMSGSSDCVIGGAQ